MSFLKKNWLRLLLGAGVLLLVVFLFQNRHWFSGAFYSKKIRLEETAMSVERMKEISRWVTAEYYGEVLYSWKEFCEEAQVASRSDFVPIAQVSTIEEYYRWRDSALLFIQQANEGTVNLLRYPPHQITMDVSNLLDFNERRTIRQIENNDLFSQGNLKKVGRRLEKMEAELLGNTKRDLVLLGRGWIKAGYALEDLAEDRIQFRPQQDTLYVSGMPEPRIITATINPWFIPNQLKGYEIVFEKKSKKFSAEDVQNVKVGCVRKLEAQAVAGGILEQAEVFAKNALLAMFAAAGNEEIRTVVFEAPPVALVQNE